MVELDGQHGRVSLHWAVELGAEDRQRFLRDRGWDEPFSRDEPQPRPNRFVDQHLWLERVELRADQRRIEEVHAHATGPIRHLPHSTAALWIVHATDRR